MQRSAPDRTLRRVIAQLASLGEDDLAMVLVELSPRERRSAERLLHDQSGASSASIDLGCTEFGAIGLAPWLVELLRREGGVEQAVTASARAHLRSCAQLLPSAAQPRRAYRSRSLLSRIGDALVMPTASA